jgi:hypothetical protein
MKHLFTGPSMALSADGNSVGTRPCNAHLHNMTAVEAENIAYGVIQVCLSVPSDFQHSYLCYSMSLYRAVLLLVHLTSGRKTTELTTIVMHTIVSFRPFATPQTPVGQRHCMNIGTCMYSLFDVSSI